MCAYVYVYIHAYIYIYTHIYAYISLSLSIYIYILFIRLFNVQESYTGMADKFPMDMRIPPLKINIMLESNPLKSRILVWRSAEFQRGAGYGR